jgi:hypothetical protein
MTWFARKRKSLPLKSVEPVTVGKRMITEAMDIITQATNNGTGGLIAVMKTKKNTMYTVPMDTLCGYRPTLAYTGAYLNARIDDTVGIINHAWTNPQLYGLEDLGIGKKDRLAVVAMATPIDFKGIVTTDKEAYGWEVVAVTAAGTDFDFLILDGNIIGGSTSFDLGKIFKSEEIPALGHGIRKGSKMVTVFHALSSNIPVDIDFAKNKFYTGKPATGFNSGFPHPL